METVIKNKIDKILSQLVKTKYFNPFENSSVYKVGKKIGFSFIPKGMGYNGCAPLGFYGTKMCEIVISQEQELSQEQQIHLNLLIKKWNLCPYVLFVNNLGKIISLNQFTQLVKRKRELQVPDNSWISASSTRNYMLDDPIIDFLKERIIKRPRSNSSDFQPNQTFLSRVFENGNKFEESIIKKIKSLVPEKDFIEIAKSYEARSLEKYNLTIKAINNKIPIIYQPVLWNHSNKTFGCADLIIRSDYACKLFPSYSNYNLVTPVYEVYDIKWSNIKLRAGSDHVINDILIKPYKAQILIYTDALNKIQSNKATRGFIIGKNYTREKTVNKVLQTENYLNPFEKLGVIDFTAASEQENIDKTVEAVEWLKEIKTNVNLCVDPPNDSRLYPNMKNTYDSEFHSIKKNLANKNREITMLYSVGKKSRDLALSQGITRWDNPKINSEVLGIKQKTKLASLIDGIIDVNRPENNEIITWANISNYGNWKTSPIKCYVDIETIGKTVYNLDLERSNFIFMIGLGVFINGKWEFTVFTAQTLEAKEEQRIIREFEVVMEQINSKYSELKQIPVFHWSNYENTNLRPFVNISEKFEFFDMCKWFKNDEICVKGAFDFKLKSITRALCQAGLTQVNWDDNVCGGLDAMNQAYIYYKSDLSDKKILKDIEYYNEIDCKSMSEIHNILQKVA